MRYAHGPKLNIKPVIWGGGNDMLVILDTNVLSYLLINDARVQIENFLEESKNLFEKKNLSFHQSISMVSVFECLRDGDYTKYYDLLEKIYCFETNDEVTYLAAMMQQYLKKHGESNKDIGDLYIGATAIITCGAILTANPDDFSPKFFKELVIRNISWKSKERTRNVTLYVLRPDYIKMKDKLIHVVENL